MREICGFPPPEISRFTAALRGSSYGSVDLFLESRPEFLEIGKAAIAAILIDCEREERLFPGSYLKHRGWYHLLFERMRTPNHQRFVDNKVRFVTLNYDRSLEHFFFIALHNSFNLGRRESAELVQTFAPIHVYGQLGWLPWQGKNDQMTRAYGADRSATAMLAAVSGLKVIHEGPGDPEVAAARDAIFEAENVYLVGFGFHPLNIERLGLGGFDRRPKLARRATALGLRGAALTEAVLRLNRAFDLDDVDAHDLLIRSIVWPWEAQR